MRPSMMVLRSRTKIIGLNCEGVGGWGPSPNAVVVNWAVGE